MRNAEKILNSLQDVLARMKAADVADMLLSPHVDADLFYHMLEDPGPGMWLVNRSDIDGVVLSRLAKLNDKVIAKRAKEKLSYRAMDFTKSLPPVMDAPIEEIEDYDIENLLGHPLAPFEAIIYFTKHKIEDYRATAALSATRRMLESPPDWVGEEALKVQVQEAFATLLVEDPSPFVRLYAARVPLLEEEHLAESIAVETHPNVLAKVAQHASFTKELLMRLCRNHPDSDLLRRVLLLDNRVDRDYRQTLNESGLEPVSTLINQWYLHFSS